MTSACCYWTNDGSIYFPNNSGTWTIEAGRNGRLVVTVDPPCGDGCGPVYYERLDGTDCGF